MTKGVFHKYQKNVGDQSYIPMADADLFVLAKELYNNVVTRDVFISRGVHGDMTSEEEDVVDRFVVNYVEECKWKSPDPRNIIIAIALARNFAENRISISNEEDAVAFIKDRRCEGVIPTIPSTYKKPRLSELLPILAAIENKDDLLAPFKTVRGTTPMVPGGAYFAEEENRLYISRVRDFVKGEMQKYCLNNRDPMLFAMINGVIGMYTRMEIEHLCDPMAISWLASRALWIIDDRGVI